MSVMRGAAVFGGATLLSRLFGYARDVLVAAKLGAGAVSDAFFVAYRTPNLIRMITAEGAFQNAYIPLYSELRAKEGDEAAERFAGETLGVMLALLTPVCVVGVVFMPALLHVLAGGLTKDPAQFELAVALGRIHFPYILFVSITAFFGGAENSRGRFFPFAFSPVILNVAMIVALLFFSGNGQNEAAFAQSWAVPAGGVLQVAWMMWFARKHGVTLPRRPRLTPEIRKLGRRMLPGVLGGSVVQINLWVNTLLASYSAGMVSVLYYADRLLQLPTALIGTALGVALLPALSKSFAAGDATAIRKTQNKALQTACLLTFPAAAGLFALSPEIIGLLFRHGEFTAEDALKAAETTRIFALGLPAFTLARVLAPGFFAAGDTSTPLKTSAATLAFNAALTVLLMNVWDYRALAAGPAAAAWFNTVLQWILLKRKHAAKAEPEAARFIIAAAAASLAMAACVYTGARLLDGRLTDDQTALRALALAALIGVGGAVYALMMAALPGAGLKRMLELTR